MNLLKKIAWTIRHPILAGCWWITGLTYSEAKECRARILKSSKGLWAGTILALFTITALYVSGCKATLDSAGVYSQPGGGGIFLFTIDKTLVDSKDTLNNFVSWEYAHHDQVLTNWPSVAQAADSIRANAPQWFADAEALRSAFVTSSSIVNSNALNAKVQLIKTSALTSGPYTNNIK